MPSINNVDSSTRKSHSKPPTIINNYYYVQAPSQPLPHQPTSQSQLSSSTQSLQGSLNPITPNIPIQANSLQQQYANQQQEFLFQEQQRIRHQNQLNNQLQQSQILRQEPQRISSNEIYNSSNNNNNIPIHHNHHHSLSSRSSPQRKSPQRKSPSRVSSAISTSSGISENNYDSFIQNSNKHPSHGKRSPSRKSSNLIENYYQRENIYSSTSIGDDSRNKFQSDSDNSSMIAKLPNIETDYLDTDLLDDRIISVSNKNLISELMKLNNDEISVHNNDFFKFYESCCTSNSSLNIEQLGSILYEPYKPNSRLSFKTLNFIMNTFNSKSNIDEMNFRNFVKMCNFIKGCYVSFNYHDKRGNDHVLDFEEFRKALKSNRIVCPDDLLAQIFQNSETLDFENYIIAIILIRKNEKKSHS